MEYEIVRLTRHPLVHFDNDATSCYDRIPCFLANVVSRKYGQSAKVCMVQGGTLQKAKYYLKTKFGISEEYVQHTQESPWFGTGQGSGNSPMYWLLISSTLYDIFTKEVTRGATYESPDHKIQIKLTQLGFVDDVNNRTNLQWNDQATIPNLLQMASQDSQLWYDIMEAANQSLELTKCKYHVMEFTFKPSGKPIMVTHENPEDQLVVQDKHQNRVTIQHTPNNKAIKYLGCWKAPQGQTQQKEELMRKCNGYARTINCSTLTRKETSYFYEGIYKPSVGYPLPTTYFKESELEKIQAKAHQAMVTHSGYNRFTARAVLYGTKDLGGAEFTHLYDIQGFGQIEMFLKSWRAKHTHQSKVLRIALQWAQYCAGTSISIVIDNSTKLPHLESEWISSLRKYLHRIKGSIQVDQPGIPPRMREQDEYIMDTVIQTKRYKPHQIRKINYCRLYLNVTTISEIANAKGDMITKEMMEGNRDSNQDKWQRVHQQKPDNTSWNLWKQVCKEISNKVNGKWYLKKSLGKWLISREENRKRWKFWYDRNKDELYQETEEGFTQHKKLWHDFDEEGQRIQDLPRSAIPVDVTKGEYTWRLQPYFNGGVQTEPDQNEGVNIPQMINNLGEWERKLLQHIDIQVSEERLRQEMQQPIRIASDGSVQGHRASFAWTIATTTGISVGQSRF